MVNSTFDFEYDILNSVAGGFSAIDIPKLNIKSLEAASFFIKTYGFNLESKNDLEKIWYYHRRSIVLLTERLGFSETEIPEILRDPKKLEDIRYLLLWASDTNPENKKLQKWSCALLRCLHVFVHSENDLFSSFSEEIQAQILSPFQKAIVHDGQGIMLKGQRVIESVDLLGFEIKPFKTSASTVIKLLAKPDALAMKIFDKLGVRFVTRNLFDSFQVIRFMIEENLMSFPHIMPDQSSNNLYPVDLFIQVCDELRKMSTDPLDNESVHRVFEKRLAEQGDKAKLFRKANEQSSTDFQFIKFITRQLIRIESPGREPFSFFFPFEVQIMDSVAHQKILSGPSQHEAYKERQKLFARRRLFPEEL